MLSNDSPVKKFLYKYGIFGLCLGYFAFYIPFSMLIKMATKGLFDGMDEGFAGFTVQSMASVSTFVCCMIFLTLSKWWRYTAKVKILGFNVSRPRWFTFVSGLLLGGIIATTIMAYTFDGISIVFAMLLMRGGVLVIAPVIDILAKRKRHIYWPSWIAAGLALSALFVAYASRGGTDMTLPAMLNILLYLFCYFFRLLFMSNRAKTDDSAEKRGYLAEEQMTANTFVPIALFITGFIGSFMDPASSPGLIWQGFTMVPQSAYLLPVIFIGVFSYCTGTFGTLIILDKRENTFTLAANRSSSIISGVVATYLLAIFFAQRPPSVHQLIGTGLVITAIVFLTYRVASEKKKKRKLFAKG